MKKHVLYLLIALVIMALFTACSSAVTPSIDGPAPDPTLPVQTEPAERMTEPPVVQTPQPAPESTAGAAEGETD